MKAYEATITLVPIESASGSSDDAILRMLESEQARAAAEELAAMMMRNAAPLPDGFKWERSTNQISRTLSVRIVPVAIE